MPALYPMMSAVESFRPDDCVRKFISEQAVTPYIGVVTHIVPATCKVHVQWPYGNDAESPETLVVVNPDIVGFPSALTDASYSSYEKTRSEKQFGKSSLAPRSMKSRSRPFMFRMATENEKMAIRIAHTFSTNVLGKLTDEICACQAEGLNDLQAYDRAFKKFGSICPDHLIRYSTCKIYGIETKE